MEILNKNSAFLSNCEVYGLLQQTKDELARKVLAKKSKHAKNQQQADPLSQQLSEQQSAAVDKHLPTVIYESLRYLERTPCAHQTPEVIRDFLRKLEERRDQFPLTKAERLQLINQRPASAVELQVLIEDNEERFSLEQMDELLQFVLDHLPHPSDPAETNSAEPETSA
jgi:hypothetical protein